MNVDRATREAVDWLLRLESACPGDANAHAFERWLTQAPEHIGAWQRVNGLFAAPLADLASVNARSPGQLHLATQALHQPLPRRRVLGGGLAALLLGVGAVSLGNRVTPVTQLLADLHSATGERQNRTLPDGSRLTLDARSATDLNFADSHRHVHLRQGALHLRVAASGAQPLVVESRDGLMYSQDARLSLRQLESTSLLSVLEGRVRVESGSGLINWVQAGQVLRLDRLASQFVAPSVNSRSDWLEGRAEMRDEPLGDLIQALRPYHASWLRISPQATRLPVYGSFPLADLSRTLGSLEETLPLQIQRTRDWLIRIDLKNT